MFGSDAHIFQKARVLKSPIQHVWQTRLLIPGATMASLPSFISSGLARQPVTCLMTGLRSSWLPSIVAKQPKPAPLSAQISVMLHALQSYICLRRLVQRGIPRTNGWHKHSVRCRIRLIHTSSVPVARIFQDTVAQHIAVE